jgi:CRP/FNR family transcriptional regulator, cyclic AMP receptor protein
MIERSDVLDRILAADRAVRLVDEDPELFAAVPQSALPELRRRAVVPLLRLERGGWDGRPPGRPDSCLGLLVLEGLLRHSVAVAGQPRSVLVGPGDVVRPWEHDEVTASVPFDSHWEVLHPVRLAVLDARFLVLASRFPQLIPALIARTTRRARWLALQLAVTDVRRVDERLMLFFWHMADRWGRVLPEGVLVPLPVTHDVLAQLVCAQRPTVTSALRRLTNAGRIHRRRDRSWILEPPPPAAFERRSAEGPVVAA